MLNQPSAQEVRSRMRNIRAGLVQHIEEAKHDANQLTDWKFYIKRYPSVLLPCVSLLAYAMVPKKQFTPTQSTLDSSPQTRFVNQQENVTAPKTSHLKSIASAAFGFAVRSATSFAVAKISNTISQVAADFSAKERSVAGERREK